MSARRFGISTHLYHHLRLTRDHLLEIAAHGFEAVELFATGTHVAYANPTVVADLQEWLADAGLTLHGIHAPVGEHFANGRWGPLFSLASADEETRTRALAEAELALYVARRIPCEVFVVHLGLPRATNPTAADNSRQAARRSIEALERLAAPLGVRVALEIIPNELSRADALVHFIEQVLDGASSGICLDFGHAHMDGDLVDAIETVSEHIVTTHVHDNRGRTDDHLLPFDGTIDWPAALTSLQKIGYEGTLLFEVAASGAPRDTLLRARAVRRRMERLLADEPSPPAGGFC
jgi:sugar phosphate isomerase/epimerase